jgi:hypothetical protein
VRNLIESDVQVEIVMIFKDFAGGVKAAGKHRLSN